VLATNGEGTAHFDRAGRLAVRPTLESLRQDATLEVGPGSFDGSRIVEGYLKGLERLGLKDALLREIGSTRDFEGIGGTFHVADGEVRVPRLDIRLSRVRLQVDGTCSFDGAWRFAVHPDFQGLSPDMAKVMASVEKAGGIVVEGEPGAADRISIPSPRAFGDALGAGDERKKTLLEDFEKEIEKGHDEIRKALERDILGGEKDKK
jgi:hypothetical protein